MTTMNRPRFLTALACAALLAGCDRPIFESLALGEDAVRQVSKGTDADARDDHGRTPLMLAAERGDAALVRALLDAGAKWDVRDGSKRQPLHMAVQTGTVEAVGVLLDAGAAIDSTAGTSNTTPLHLAFLRGTPDIAELLLRRGANVHAVTTWGETIAHLVAANRVTTEALFPLLVRYGADFDRVDSRGFQPLHTAAIADNAAFLRASLGRSAGKPVDIDAPTLMGESPLDLAFVYRCDVAGDWLVRNGAKARKSNYKLPPLLEAVRADDVPRVTILMAHGSDPNHATGDVSALDLARREHDEAMLRILSPARQERP